MSINREEIIKKVNEIGRHDLMESSSLRKDNFLDEFIRKLEPKPEAIIEIGTYNGISTVILASVGNIVYTYDISHRDAEFIWNLFGIREKIRCLVAPQWQIDFDISWAIGKRLTTRKSKFNFNLAVIDGEHTYKNVKHDFELVKFCRRVLFHDYQHRPIRKFLDEIGAKPIGPKATNGYCIWAYWEDK